MSHTIFLSVLSKKRRRPSMGAPFTSSSPHSHANQCRPKPPPPFIPSFEQLRIARRDKDAEINSRIRGPPLPRFLSPEDDAEVSRLLERRGIIAKVASLQVTDTDLSRLRPGTWLNDEIINFYGQLILERSTSHPRNTSVKNGARSEKGSILNVHYFNSFFFEKLVREGYQKARLAKWTKKVCRAQQYLEHVTYGH
jgi:sentrin-specific protease 1